ncbi:MAG: oligoribonuclease [Proteobacteria bacterium]|nr:MAG: oligoribonuclease [Pseudomonadota bacterium]
MPKETDDRMVWIDLEMSGLDPDKERVLEMALLVTDGALEIIAEGPEVVLKQDDALLEGMDAWNRKHHGESGLIERVRASEVDDAAADALAVEFLRAHCPEGRCPLAGSSVHQDRRFISRYLPRLDNYLNYRLVDVSSVKELVRRWLPTIYARRPEKRGLHRAMDDIRESIDELRYYRKHAFLRPEGLVH